MEDRYSPDFSELIAEEGRVRKLIEDSCTIITGGDYFEIWRKKRDLAVEAINKNGSILDIGCANGFFLRCLIEWADFDLVPYGIDVEEEKIEEAKKLFYDGKESFIVFPLRMVESLDQRGLPKKYDFVYWNVWDDYEFEEDEYLKLAFSAVKKGGRLILAFYDREEERRNWKIEKVKKLGYNIGKVIENKYGLNSAIAWIDK